MTFFAKVLIDFLCLVLCPVAYLTATWHVLRTGHRQQSVYCYNMRYLMFCTTCEKVYLNELTQDEVDELEAHHGVDQGSH